MHEPSRDWDPRPDDEIDVSNGNILIPLSQPHKTTRQTIDVCEAKIALGDYLNLIST